MWGAGVMLPATEIIYSFFSTCVVSVILIGSILPEAMEAGPASGS